MRPAPGPESTITRTVYMTPSDQVDLMMQNGILTIEFPIDSTHYLGVEFDKKTVEFLRDFLTEIESR